MTNIFCFFSIHFPDEKQNALFKVRWQSFVFIWGRFFGPFVFSLKERSDGKKRKVDGGKTFWRLNGEEVLYGLRESQSVILKTRSVFCDENWIKFFYMNKYEFLWKATVFTKNTLQTRTEIFHCFDTFQQH